jgi:hypothetical protein
MGVFGYNERGLGEKYCFTKVLRVIGGVLRRYGGYFNILENPKFVFFLKIDKSNLVKIDQTE